MDHPKKLLTSFQHHGHTLAAADTQRGQAEVMFFAKHFAHECQDDPGTAATNGMSD
jgi:hypothetical protein